MIENKKLGIVMLLFASSFSFAQTASDKPSEPAKQEDEFAKKKVETKLTEVVPTDSLGVGDLMKRAIAWTKSETDKYKKTDATTTGSKVECTASFPVKPKELNPEVDFSGKITMKVVIECKNSKYRYTVSEIKHISKTGNTSGGSIDNVVAECGSMGMNDQVWKKLKGQALVGAGLVVADIKIGMGLIPEENKGEDDW
ncbi:hypothetical protein [Aurantibacillus circumpalustris]|uniref:hypothetical protein n=1 Tax=Aurantibacillus circumpalustris TaxID=3036359 RepID=UPI00295B2D97|nr:hypothetical protein [Aurantibacillus circumpalustris]